MVEPRTEVSALKVNQWLPSWDGIKFDPDVLQRRPEPFFFVLSMPAADLRALVGIYRRNADRPGKRSDDLGIQRVHDRERSAEIARYIEGGYPWSTLTSTKRAEASSETLRKPGWLPTAVVVNVLRPGAVRDGRELDVADALEVVTDGGKTAVFRLPESFTGPDWEPSCRVAPMEVIDGQHRLWAFDEDQGHSGTYEVPVVAFMDLDVSWQAYLFWTINIKPKKINPSLAFDLYPLLREQEWLEAGEGLSVYRETRAQELTEALWSTPESPWFQRISMLGHREGGPVTQASFIRSLIASFVKSWSSSRSPIGGLFGGYATKDRRPEGLGWTRVQQAAFLVFSWRSLAASIKGYDYDWAQDLREIDMTIPDIESLGDVPDPAFSGPYTLLATDQGVRGFLHVLNDTCYVRSRQLQLSAWLSSADIEDVTPDVVVDAMEDFSDQPAAEFVAELCDALATYDWRAASRPRLPEQERTAKLAFRGSGGYKELRRQLTRHVSGNGSVGAAADDVIAALKL